MTGEHALIEYEIIQLYVKKTFLNGTLSDEIYLEIPDGVEGEEKSGNCYGLRKALQGL